ncbi:MAG: DUF2218 domain-containing protein [Mobilicoccus sp.]|nr:DUF2218 domain-containing protein [Mobilicoccus sp.]
MIASPILKVRDKMRALVAPQLPVVSVGVVRTDRAPRYARQLASHLGRKTTTSWSEDAGSGSVEFDARSYATLTTTDFALTMTLTCPEHRVAELRDVLGRHLKRFGERDGLTVTWETHARRAG